MLSPTKEAFPDVAQEQIQLSGRPRARVAAHSHAQGALSNPRGRRISHLKRASA
jgi:hypothetical protein